MTTLDNGWTGYADGAAYSEAADFTRATWWQQLPNRDARRDAYLEAGDDATD